MNDIVAKNPDNVDKPHYFIDGSYRSVAELPSCFIGKGTYNHGWRWSEHAGAQTGKPSERHVGYVLSGNMVVKSADDHGGEVTVGPGEAFETGPNHDAWVLGNEPCIALDFTAK